MKDRVSLDARLLKRLSRARDRATSDVFARAQLYNKAAAMLGLQFDEAVAAGKLPELTAIVEGTSSDAAK
jgi:hypothetical protein